MSASELCTELAIICWAEAHPGSAAWVQAILTPVALVVAVAAVLIPERGRRRDAQAQRLKLLQSAAGAGAIAAGAVRLIHGAAELARSSPDPNFEIPRFLVENGVRAVREFPSSSLSDPAALAALHNLELLAAGAMHECDRLEGLARAYGLSDEYVGGLAEQVSQADAAWRILAQLAGATPEEIKDDQNGSAGPVKVGR